MQQWKLAKVARRAHNLPRYPMTVQAAGFSILANQFPGNMKSTKGTQMNNKKLNGKVAVVTGASKGIGAGIAKELATEGASVVVNYASSKEDAEKVVAQITKAGGKAIAVGGSVAKAAEIEKLFAETKKAYGKVDILVNNAGVYKFERL